MCFNICYVDVFAGSVGDSFFNSFNAKAHPIKTVLQDEPQPQQQQHSLDNCFTSFMGNTSLPFDIQVCLFIEKYLFIAPNYSKILI
jgi:hypothetical protein